MKKKNNLCSSWLLDKGLLSVHHLIKSVLLIHKMQVEVIPVSTNLKTDAALPRAELTMQGFVQKVQASLLKADPTVLTSIQPALRFIINEKILKGRKFTL